MTAIYRSSPNPLSDKAKREIDVELRESKAQQWGEKCAYLAPYICYHTENDGWRIQQGCCNHWDCPRCGHIRAREEYGRIVQGAKTIGGMGKAMYFWTLTCRGKELSLDEAEKGYLKWTDKLLTAARNRAARHGGYWCYVQVTERQTRQHPHSHMICTFAPGDAIAYGKGAVLPNGRTAKTDLIWSEWFVQANISAGLGQECQISLIRSPAAVATYVSKYLFKDAITTAWPKGWKRVRYSKNWPKLPEADNPTAFPVITLYDWMRVADLREPVKSDSVTTYIAAHVRGIVNVKAPTGWL